MRAEFLNAIEDLSEAIERYEAAQTDAEAWKRFLEVMKVWGGLGAVLGQVRGARITVSDAQADKGALN